MLILLYHSLVILEEYTYNIIYISVTDEGVISRVRYWESVKCVPLLVTFFASVYFLTHYTKHTTDLVLAVCLMHEVRHYLSCPFQLPYTCYITYILHDSCSYIKNLHLLSALGYSITTKPTSSQICGGKSKKLDIKIVSILIFTCVFAEIGLVNQQVESKSVFFAGLFFDDSHFDRLQFLCLL